VPVEDYKRADRFRSDLNDLVYHGKVEPLDLGPGRKGK
jgi:hypothetical protein